MADRTVTVRLRAQISEYSNALKKAQGETTAFGRLAAKDFSKLGSDIESVGKQMTMKVTLPVLAGGAAALKLGNDFETAFAQMVGLAGVTADEVDGLRESILDLSGETAVAPVQLAEALYFASSAGLDTANALEAVEMAAKASAAGMGPAADIVGLVASAMAAYGSEAVDAAEATDVLTATIRAGRADPRELAGSLGVVLPIASQLGITFDEVGGTVAYLSNIFGDTSRTTNSLRAMFANLLSPTEQGRKTLEEFTGSADSLKHAIDRDGLTGALEVLRTSGIANSDVAMRSLFSDIDGYTAAISLLSDENGQLTGTLDAVANSAGSLDTAFAAVESTDAFKMKQAWAELQVTLIQVGGQLAPIAADFADLIRIAAQFFGALPDWAQKGVIGFVLMSAAMGPLMTQFGLLKSGVEVGVRAFQRLQVQMALARMEGLTTGQALRGLAGSAINPVTLAITAGVTALFAWQKGKADARNRTMEFTAALEADNGVLDTNTEALIRNKVAQGDLNDNITQAGYTYEQFVAALESGDEASQAVIKGIFERGKLTGDEVLALGGLVDAYQSATREVAENAEAGIDNQSAAEQQAAALARLEAQFGGTGAAAGGAVSDVDALTAALNEMYGSIFGLDSVALGVDNAFADFNSTMSDTDEQTTRVGKSSDAAADRMKAIERAARDVEKAERSLADAHKQVTRSVEDVADAEKDLEEARKGPDAKTIGEASRRRRGDALALQRAQQGVKRAQEELTKAQEDGDPAEIKDKQLALKEALLARENASASLSDATDRLSELQSWNAETADEVKDAQDKLTEAKDRAEEATRNVGDRERELGEAQEASRDTAAKSVADFDNSTAAVGRHKDKVLEARNAYDQLGQSIRARVGDLIALNVSAADKFEELVRWRDLVNTNPFLTDDQRADLLELIKGNMGTFFAGGKGGFSAGGGILGQAYGGVIKPKAGGTLVAAAEAGVAEAFVPLTPAGLSAFMPAMAGYSGGGGGDTHLHFHAGVMPSRRELGELVETALRTHGRDKGSLDLGRIRSSN